MQRPEPTCNELGCKGRAEAKLEPDLVNIQADAFPDTSNENHRKRRERTVVTVLPLPLRYPPGIKCAPAAGNIRADPVDTLIIADSHRKENSEAFSRSD